MRIHRHQVGRGKRWHSVRFRHDSVWDWCAHHEEVMGYLPHRRSDSETMLTSKQFKLQLAH